jgi:hypothetical protein
VNRSIAVQHSAYLSSTPNELGEATIVCCICQAVYTPSRSHTYLLQGPPIALESALMSMCHFCFRCRRPSCPACWDNVHGVCGQCTIETGLPFRLEPAPLDGAQFTPTRSPAASLQNAQSSLINVQPGRFQRSSSPIDVDSVPTRPDVTGPVNVDSVPTRPDVASPRPTARAQRSRSLDIDEIETRPDQKGSHATIAGAKTRPGRSHPFNIDEIETRPDQNSSPDRSDVAAAKTRPDPFGLSRRRVRRVPVLLVVVSIILIAAIILLLVAALLLPDVNTFLRSLLHIDIRTQIARFWHLLQHLF